MPDAMRDRGLFWSAAPSRAAAIARSDVSARFVSGLGQTLVSGDIDGAIAALACGAPCVGLWELVEDERFAVRMARDRALIVSASPLDATVGWRDGFAATPCDDGFAVIEIAGEGVRDIVAEATAADLDSGSLSAAILFAGVGALLYRTGPDTARIHVEAPLAAYLWRWLEERG